MADEITKSRADEIVRCLVAGTMTPSTCAAEIRAAITAAQDHEREECAKLAAAYSGFSSSEYGVVAAREIAKAILSRKTV